MKIMVQIIKKLQVFFFKLSIITYIHILDLSYLFFRFLRYCNDHLCTFPPYYIGFDVLNIEYRVNKQYCRSWIDNVPSLNRFSLPSFLRINFEITVFPPPFFTLILYSCLSFFLTSIFLPYSPKTYQKIIFSLHPVYEKILDFHIHQIQ